MAMAMHQCSHTEMEQLDVDQKILEKDVNPVCFWGFDFWHIVLKKDWTICVKFHKLYSFLFKESPSKTVQVASIIHHSWQNDTKWTKAYLNNPKPGSLDVHQSRGEAESSWFWYVLVFNPGSFTSSRRSGRPSSMSILTEWSICKRRCRRRRPICGRLCARLEPTRIRCCCCLVCLGLTAKTLKRRTARVALSYFLSQAPGFWGS